jgi:hypothetical protein
MKNKFQTQQIEEINKLHELQQKVSYYEKNQDYRNGMDPFINYIEYIRTLDQPITLISMYIRFAKFCMHHDTLFARDLYNEAKILLHQLEEQKFLDPSVFEHKSTLSPLLKTISIE